VLLEGGEFGNGEYLSNLIDYVHLNPVRAGLIELQAKQSPSEYRWSGLASGYLVAVRKRAKWIKTDEGFGIVGIKDTVSGRREHLGRIEKKGLEDKGALNQPENQSLQSTLVRGWYRGTEQFKEVLMSRANRTRRPLWMIPAFFSVRVYDSAPGVPTNTHVMSVVLMLDISQYPVCSIVPSDRLQPYSRAVSWTKSLM
jgi:hypothetical protein